MKYATFDADGKLNGRYDSGIHSIIPAGAVELSEELFFQTINENDGIWKLVGGVVAKTAFPPPPPLGPPTIITIRQARLALFQSGHLAAVDALIDAMPGAQGDSARIEWEFASDVMRTHPLVTAMAASLPLNEQQLDDLFTLGASL